MLRNYLKIAIRNLRKDKLITGINLLGLSLGIMTILLTALIVRHEMSYDKFHDGVESIYTLGTKLGTFSVFSSPPPLGEGLTVALPEVTSFTRSQHGEGILKIGDAYSQQRLKKVDPNYIHFFNFPVERGNTQNPLDKIDAMLVTHSWAEKHFGDKDPVGEFVELNLDSTFRLFTVSGVLADIPENSSLQFEVLINFENGFLGNSAKHLTNYRRSGNDTYIRISDPDKFDEIEAKVSEFGVSKLVESLTEDDDPADYGFFMSSFADRHLSGNRFIGSYAHAPIDPNYIYIMMVLGGIMLLIASFNFMNLTNAKASGRLVEIGIRKVIGAGKRQLIQQFLSESLLMSLVATIVAVVMVDLCLPWVNSFLGYELSLNLLSSPSLLLAIIGFGVFAGLLGGAYPAMALSRLSVFDSFKQSFSIGKNNWLTRLSIVFQFAISAGLIVCTWVMYQQQKFIQEVNLGFDQEQVVIIPTQYDPGIPEHNTRILAHFRQSLEGNSLIKGIAGTSNAFYRGTMIRLLEGPKEEELYAFEYGIDDKYVDVLGLEILKGRNLSSDKGLDFTQSILVNEEFVKQMEIENPIGHVLGQEFGEFENPIIVGVVKNFHNQDLRQKIHPAVLHMGRGLEPEEILIKISPDDVAGTLALLKTTWEEIQPQKPLEYFFMDEEVDALYESEQKWGGAIRYVSFMVILIACMGLLGLTALTVVRRTKEVGIRKVLGASVGQLMYLLSSQFLLLVLISNVIAWPISWWLMNKWLEGFAFKTNFNGWGFFMAGMVTFLIAFLTISTHTYRSASANPTESLRDE